MAPKPEAARLAYVFGMVLTMAATILAIRRAIWLHRARHRFTVLNFSFCTKAVDQLFAAEREGSNSTALCGGARSPLGLLGQSSMAF
jgi:hypothetical protein